jgi:hypothetical protein
MGFDVTSFAQLLRVAERDRLNRIASDWHCVTRGTQRRSATRCRFGARPEVQSIGTWGQAVWSGKRRCHGHRQEGSTVVGQIADGEPAHH